MTPSLPTFCIASASILPVSGSPPAAIVPTLRTSSGFSRLTALESRLSSAMIVSTALSMPRLMAIGLAPAVTFLRPSSKIASASTVAVVVPSPATSFVFEATSFTIWAPMFSYGSLSSISLATVTPSTLTIGAPHFFSRSTARPRGPSVTLTARASCFTPRRIASRASWSNAILLADMASPSIFRYGLLADHGKDFALAEDEVFLPVDLHVGSGKPAEEDAIALLHFERLHFAVLEHASGADGHDRALLGLVLGGVGEKDAAGGLLLRLAPFDDDLIAQRL